MPIWGHPKTQVHVVAQPSIASLAAMTLAELYNPNLVVDQTSLGFALAEAEVIAATSRLVGYDPGAAFGCFTFGGTGTILYAIRAGIEKVIPGAMQDGVAAGDVVVFTSDKGHYSAEAAVGWLGLGTERLVKVPTSRSNEMRVDVLERMAREAIEAGRRIGGLVATMGTTDSFGVDDLEAIVALRDALVDDYRLDYRPHVHADA